MSREMIVKDSYRNRQTLFNRKEMAASSCHLFWCVRTLGAYGVDLFRRLFVPFTDCIPVDDVPESVDVLRAPVLIF